MQKLFIESVRVKYVELHDTNPWVLSALFNGELVITDYSTGKEVKRFEVSSSPLRAAKFVTRRKWVICGGDDMKLVVYNYETSEKVVEHNDAHQDFIRSIVVHPVEPYAFSSSDDLLINMWDFSKEWKLVRSFSGCGHFIMQTVLNPNDPNTFATASLDRSIRMWKISDSTSPILALDGHSKGVNSVGFCYEKNKSLIVSGADDFSVKVWDYQTKKCVQTLEGHKRNVNYTCFHPRIGYIISGGEDNYLILWSPVKSQERESGKYYALEKRITPARGRIWSIACSKKSLYVAVGCDSGTVILSLGKEVPQDTDEIERVKYLMEEDLSDYDEVEEGKNILKHPHVHFQPNIPPTEV